jgi:2-methylisocitrate lyase-like PEP mutase family enzyme
VIEDKTFPKDSSLRPGGRQVLVPIKEFQGNIAAARISDGPLVVARTEALIAGLGQAEALRHGSGLRRGRRGCRADPQQRKDTGFCRAWPGQAPLVLVPTAYPQLSFAEIAALGKVGLIICANHAIRAAVAAMRVTFSRLLGEGGIAGIEGTIAMVAEIFSLQGDERMRDLEARFLR